MYCKQCSLKVWCLYFFDHIFEELMLRNCYPFPSLWEWIITRQRIKGLVKKYLSHINAIVTQFYFLSFGILLKTELPFSQNINMLNYYQFCFILCVVSLSLGCWDPKIFEDIWNNGSFHTEVVFWFPVWCFYARFLFIWFWCDKRIKAK